MFKQKQKYHRVRDLHEKYGGRRMGGIANCPNHQIIFIFSGKTGEQHGYEDGWDKENYFWYSGEGQKGDMTFSGGNKSILNHQQNEKRIFLFEKTKESGYWVFIDELKLVNYEYYNISYKDDYGNQNQRIGIKFKFLSVSIYSENEKLQLPETKPKTYNYNKPNKTEYKGLVVSRVGQGYYRQQILDKWNNKCGVTGSGISKILISSHIVPWKDSNDNERLDPENGILLSPNLDGLFDRYLISFRDSGEIIISNNITELDLERLGIRNNMKLSQVTDGMKPYLKRHRDKFNSL